MPKFAANLSLMFSELPFLERIAAASAAGFHAIECQFPYEVEAAAIASELRQSAIDLVLFNLPPGDWTRGDRGLAALANREAEFRQSLSQALAYAQACRTKCLHAMAGIADRADRSAMRTYRDNLAYAADYLAPHGVSLLIEPINQHDMPGYYLSDFDHAAELIDLIGSPQLRLQFDIYHRQRICGEVIAGLRDLLPLIGHIQVAGVPGRHEPAQCELDFPTIFAEIDRLGYDGFIGCEYRPRGTTAAGLDWLKPYLASP